MISQHNDEDVERILRLIRLGIGIVVTLITALLGATWFLLQDHFQQVALTERVAALSVQVQEIDRAGTRALDFVRNRQNDVIATNAGQDMRLRELEREHNELQRTTAENKYLIDQALQILRVYAHPALMVPERKPPPPPDGMRLQSDGDYPR
jgi:hypothetical protein